MRTGLAGLGLLLSSTILVVGLDARGAQVAVQHTEGLVHGFLKVSTLAGAPLADGDLIQTAEGARVTSRLTFRFHDGSLHDETTVFSEDKVLRLIRYTLVQKGPAFPRAVDMTIDAATGQVVVRYADHGQTKVASDRVTPSSDLANGLLLTILKNARPASPPASLSYIAATPEPRLVRLGIRVAGQEPFKTGRTARKATHYVITVHIGGLTGLLANVFGKAPPDSHVWILGGDAPAFVKSEQTFFVGGPIWRLELVSPEWR